MKEDYRVIPPIRPFNCRYYNTTIHVRERRRRLQHARGSLFVSILGTRCTHQNHPFAQLLTLRLFARLLPYSSISEISKSLMVNDFDLRMWRKVALSINTHRTDELDTNMIYRVIHDVSSEFI